MKSGWIKKLLAVTLSGAMTVGLAAAGAPAAFAAEEGGGKYVSDVFIAYGKTEDEAKGWLTDNGWEPVEGDFNAGKASFFDDNKLQDQNVAAVMGIKRTDDAEDAVTDMAVMNMTGGYSIPEYEKLLDDKKAEIKQYVTSFQAVIDEYRANYNGEGSAFGQKRAQLAHDLLNHFFDGDPEDPVAANDTGAKLGDLLLDQTLQEGNEAGGDVEQIALESSGPANLAVQTYLALASDPGDQTWLERAAGLTGDEMAENLAKYVPEAEGEDVSDSAAVQYLAEKYGDTAAQLADQWSDVNDEMIWYEQYSDNNGLWPKKGEKEDAYQKRVSEHFKAMGDKTEVGGNSESRHYFNAQTFYNSLYEIPYSGDWGETMGDFFNPAGDAGFASDDEAFLPMAAALSDGQRAALSFLSLQSLLLIGFETEEGFDQALPDVEDIFGEDTEISVYTGVNREAFRGGAAITSEALMEQNAGRGNAYNEMWDNMGIFAMTSYVAAAVGAVSVIAGGVMAAKGIKYVGASEFQISELQSGIATEKANLAASKSETMKKVYKESIKDMQDELDGYARPSKAGYAGRVLLGIGGVLLIGAAVVKGIQLWKYYDRDMTPIPLMIVDESDVVTYVTDDEGKPVTDENGEQKKNVDFNTFEYYTAVKCNRPDVGEIGDWQSGVKEYQEHNCFDVADLNADMGQEWIALYTVKSENKGYPILADSLKLQYGDSKTPEGCTKPLHLFTYTNAVDLGDTAWAFNNAKNGVYFFWDEDTSAVPAEEAASAFGGGALALAGLGGLILGIAGSTLALKPKRKKEEDAAA